MKAINIAYLICFLASAGVSIAVFFEVRGRWDSFSVPEQGILYLVPLLIFGAMMLGVNLSFRGVNGTR